MEPWCTSYSKLSRLLSYSIDNHLLFESMTSLLICIFPTLPFWATRMEKLGGGSSESHVYRCSIMEYPLFVMKVSRYNDTMGHEYKIGMHLNKLRDRIPTYVYTYSVMRSTMPIAIEDSVVRWFPKSSHYCDHLLIEDVRSSRTLQSLLPYLTLNGLMEILLQIVTALDLAHKECDFTHYDLNGKNILIQDVGERSIPIYIDGSIKSITTQWLVKIIDLGFSHVKEGDIHIGRDDVKIYGINGDRSYPMYDIHKLLGMMGKLCIDDNRLLFSLVSDLYSFFKNGTLSSRIEEYHCSKQQYNIFQPPESKREEYESMKYSDFLTVLLDIGGHKISPSYRKDSFRFLHWREIPKIKRHPRSVDEYLYVSEKDDEFLQQLVHQDYIENIFTLDGLRELLMNMKRIQYNFTDLTRDICNLLSISDGFSCIDTWFSTIEQLDSSLIDSNFQNLYSDVKGIWENEKKRAIHSIMEIINEEKINGEELDLLKRVIESL